MVHILLLEMKQHQKFLLTHCSVIRQTLHDCYLDDDQRLQTPSHCSSQIISSMMVQRQHNLCIQVLPYPLVSLGVLDMHSLISDLDRRLLVRPMMYNSKTLRCCRLAEMCIISLGVGREVVQRLFYVFYPLL